MSEEVPREQEHDQAGSSDPRDLDDEQSDPGGSHEAADEPEGAEILLPRSNWLRLAWVLLAVFWMLAMVAIFIQSCSPR